MKGLTPSNSPPTSTSAPTHVCPHTMKHKARCSCSESLLFRGFPNPAVSVVSTVYLYLWNWLVRSSLFTKARVTTVDNRHRSLSKAKQAHSRPWDWQEGGAYSLAALMPFIWSHRKGRQKTNERLWPVTHLEAGRFRIAHCLPRLSHSCSTWSQH